MAIHRLTRGEAFGEAIGAIDDDMPQYISDNTDDELSRAAFNAYLDSKARSPSISMSSAPQRPPRLDATGASPARESHRR